MEKDKTVEELWCGKRRFYGFACSHPGVRGRGCCHRGEMVSSVLCLKIRTSVINLQNKKPSVLCSAQQCHNVHLLSSLFLFISLGVFN